MFHHFSSDISGINLPEHFTNPFDYTPHALCVKAASEVREYLGSRQDWHDELSRGKMMGVLVVSRGDEIGFIAAFSGNLAGSNRHSYFVPPVYDVLNPNGYFHAEEARISAINKQIDEILAADDYRLMQAQLQQLRTDAEAAVAAHKKLMAESKACRDAARRSPDADLAAMIRESQWQKAELRRIKKLWSDRIKDAEWAVGIIDSYIQELKDTRSRRSAELQHWLFSQFVMLNANGEKRNLCEIFADTPQGEPPAGAGECAAPKLLQHAFLNHLKPIAMAEFWCGESPHGVIRHDGNFYPACKGKCLPILSFMMQGLDVADGRCTATAAVCTDTSNGDWPNHNAPRFSQLQVLYEDEYLIAVNKPAGMLCVPGKITEDSLLSHIKLRHHDAMAVHRLDMDTSGIVIFAKDKRTHKLMQHLFATRQVHKRYAALLHGSPIEKIGVISLPLCPDYGHRPQQMVSIEHGKTAITRYEVIKQTTKLPEQAREDIQAAHQPKASERDIISKVHLFPLTGRTHQLRVHCAHKSGLNAPILGDRLYGKSSTVNASRMFLHAEAITFTHPITGAEITIECNADW